VLGVLGGWAFYGKILADHLSAAANPSRVRFYVLTLLFEWLLFALVLAAYGIVARLSSLFWRSVAFRPPSAPDIGIAAAFWIVSVGILFVLAWLLRVAALGRKMDFILPHGGVEIALWIALSITAGICEETIFRGLLATAVHRPD